MNYICYHNGQYVIESEVSFSFRDLGFQRGFGIFGYLRTYNQKPFQLDWHLDRLMRSIQGLGLSCRVTRDEFLGIIHSLFEKNKHLIIDSHEYGVKIIVTGGVDGVPTILIYFEIIDLKIHNELREKGTGLLVHQGQRGLPAVKSLDYRAQYICIDELIGKNCLEVLYVNNGIVFESATSNIFVVKDNIIYTPKDDIYCGSTRLYVMNFAHEHGYQVIEQELSWEFFVSADEIFITASKKEILPITHVYNKDHRYDFQIGNITKKLIDIFENKKQEL